MQARLPEGLDYRRTTVSRPLVYLTAATLSVATGALIGISVLPGLAFAVMVCFGTAVALSWRARWNVAVGCLLGALLVIPVGGEVLGSADSALKVITIAAFGIVSLQVSTRARLRSDMYWLIASIALFTVWQIIAAIAAGMPPRSLQFLILWMIIGLGTVVAASGELDTGRLDALRRIGTVGYGSLLLSTLWGGISFRLESGFYSHPNGLALTLLFFSVFPLWTVFRGRRGIGRGVSAFMIGVLPFALFVASSRGAMLAALALFATLGWLRIPRRWAYLIAVTAIGVIVVTALYLRSLTPTEFNELVWDLFQKRPETGRLVLWGVLISLALGRPIFGYGPGGSFIELGYPGLSAHNAYLQVLFDSGVVGLACFLLMIGAIAVRLVQKRKAFPELGDPAVALLVGTVVSGLFEVSFVGNFWPGTFIFWLIVGLASSSRRDLPREERTT